MNGMATLITNLLIHALDMSATDAYAAGVWRPRCLLFAQDAGREAWNFDDWSFKFGTGTIAFVNGVGTAPAGFKNFGVGGGLYLQGGKKEVSYVPPRKFFREKEMIAQTSGDPAFYTVTGKDTITLNAAISGTYNIYYEKSRPTFTDATPGGLTDFPDEFHEVLFWGVWDRLMVPIGDGRSLMEISPRFKAGLADISRLGQHGRENEGQLGDFGYGEFQQW